MILEKKNRSKNVMEETISYKIEKGIIIIR